MIDTTLKMMSVKYGGSFVNRHGDMVDKGVISIGLTSETFICAYKSDTYKMKSNCKMKLLTLIQVIWT